MRINFPNLTRPKKAAKHFSQVLSVPLALSQNSIAKACGYRDWYDLETNHNIGEYKSEYSLDAKVNVVLNLTTALNRGVGDVQYALSGSYLLDNQAPTRDSETEIRIRCWELTDLKPVGKKQKGEIGRAKVFDKKPSIVKQYRGGLVEGLTNGGLFTFATSEYTSPNKKLRLFIPMRLYLPYGYYTEADGAKVLYSRDYNPMWRIREGQKPERLEPWLWIKTVNNPKSSDGRDPQYFNDGNAPWYNDKTRVKCEQVLTDYNINRLPMLVEALPLLINSPEPDGYNHAARLLKDYYAEKDWLWEKKQNE